MAEYEPRVVHVDALVTLQADQLPPAGHQIGDFFAEARLKAGGCLGIDHGELEQQAGDAGFGVGAPVRRDAVECIDGAGLLGAAASAGCWAGSAMCEMSATPASAVSNA